MTRLGLRKKTALCLLLCALFWLTGIVWFTSQIPQKTTPFKPDTADAIVVLTGGSGRLDYALQLLAEDKAHVLFVSGAGVDVSVADILKKTPKNIRKKINPDSIILGHTAENTIGNAEETLRWLNASEYTNIILVTANYHMPRSLLEFSVTMPRIVIIPAPILPDDFTMQNWWIEKDERSLIFSEYHKYIASKLRHWFVSATRGS